MKKFLIFFLMLLPLALASCGDDKDEPTNNTTKDPDGTVIVNVTLDRSTDVLGIEIRLTKDYNLELRYGNNYGINCISIIGPVKGIGDISATETSVQNLTWTRYAAAQVGYGYIFREDKGYELVNGERVDYCDYYAVYVADEIASTSGGVMGYTLKVRKLLENVTFSN